MKISVCIPQYNRINLLLRNLKIIEKQYYTDIEVVVSDDCSTDSTREDILELKKDYKLSLIYFRFEQNQGYDRNYRKSIELATGDYAMVLGNDDTLNGEDAIQNLVDFLERTNYPDIGYCNYVEERQPEVVIERAVDSKVYGNGINVALSHYNGFSFVAGIIYKKAVFDRYNNSKHDGSIYAQMYLGLLIIASGGSFFTMKDAFVLKDISDERGQTAPETYKNKLPKKWRDFKKVDGGLPGVSGVLIAAVQDATGVDDIKSSFKILKRIYGVNYPYWIVQYKRHGSLAAACGLILGMFPTSNSSWKKVNITGKVKLMTIYGIMSLTALATPFSIFEKLEARLRRSAKQ